MSERTGFLFPCPQCGASLHDRARYCGHCGVSIALWDFTWSLRRSIGGAVAGGVGWVLGSTFLRLTLPGADLSLPHPLFLTVAGLFLGMAGGLMERSSSRVWRGLFTGGAAGLSFGTAARFLARGASPDALFVLHVAVWALFGMAIGFSVGRLKGWETVGGFLWAVWRGRWRGISRWPWPCSSLNRAGPRPAEWSSFPAPSWARSSGAGWPSAAGSADGGG
ncbi:MAG TPA: zinc ribbon domain-containing protein [Elusimicrobiota bacterium]|nr:zinc ribbon domain-containing protein [Elusimicrobiota bacterium]